MYNHFVDLTSAIGGSFVVLPAASAAGTGMELVFKDVSGNATISNQEIRAASGDRIDGATNMLLNINYQSKAIHSDGGTNWWIH